MSEWILCPQLHWFVSCIYITVIFMNCCWLFCPFSPLVSHILWYGYPSMSFGRPCMSLSSPVPSCSPLVRRWGRLVWTWLYLNSYSYMWSECRYIYFILVALKVLTRNDWGLRWCRSKHKKQQNHLSVEIWKTRILFNQIRSEVLHPTFNSI